MNKSVPNSLRNWFLAHFVVDIVFAIPLILFPAGFLGALGFSAGDPLFARLVGAALLGIGGNSLLMHKKGSDMFNSMLNLKIIWSLAAIVVLIWALVTGAPTVVWLILAVFVLFSVTWVYYKQRLS